MPDREEQVETAADQPFDPYAPRCPVCLGELPPPPRVKKRGRRRTYCSAKCRAAAHRGRVRAQRPRRVRRSTADDELVVRVLSALSDEVGRATTLARHPDPEQPLAVVERAVQMADAVDTLRAAAIAQARSRRITWRAIAEALHTTPEAARATWPREQQRLARQAERLVVRPVRTPGGVSDRSECPGWEPGLTAVNRFGAERQVYAAALSHLHRTSGRSVRAVARDAGVSPGFVSRVLGGERLASWAVTRRIVGASGGDEEPVRLLWLAAAGWRPASRPAPEQARELLAETLRGLRLACAEPTLDRICCELNRKAGVGGEYVTVPMLQDLLEGRRLLSKALVVRMAELLGGSGEAVGALWIEAASESGRIRPPISRGPAAESFD